MNVSAIPARPLRLSWPIPLAAVLTVLVATLPLVCWFGLANPDLVPGICKLPWTNTGGTVAAAGTVFVLLAVPILVMLISHRGDMVGMWLMQNGLLAGGFFFLPITAFRLDVPNLGPSILDAGCWVAIVNALGFVVLLVVLGLTYFSARVVGADVKPLPAPPENYDARLVVMLRVAAVYCVSAVILSMAVTHTIPMLAPDPEAARYVFDDNSITRPFFNVNMGILPYVSSGLLVMFLRNPHRLLGLDGWLAGAVLMAELATGDRFPLAVAAMVSIVLLSMEKRRPRWLLLTAVVSYFILFVGLSGLTSIWRQNREAMSSHESLITVSFREAYLGNNLIDYRDAAWVFSQWDHQPLMGKTYSSAMLAMVPSGLFPMRKQWHLGQTGLRIVGWGDYEHFGLRLSCFGESFLNFGYTGVVAMGIIMGIMLGTLLRYLHLLSNPGQPPCLARNLTIVMLTQMVLIWTNTSDAFMFWSLLALLFIMRLIVFHRPWRETAPNNRRTS